MIKYSRGKIRLENKILDLSNFDYRHKITEQDLNNYYDCFINHAEEISEHFEDKFAFEKSLNDASNEKRPKLIAREPKYPSFFNLNDFNLFNYFKPSRRLNDNYFYIPHCMVSIPSKVKYDEELGAGLRKDIREKFNHFQDYEGIIEIPNDYNPLKTKTVLFHESLHYLIARYQAETRRQFIDQCYENDFSSEEKYEAEAYLNETVVEFLTDKLLIHDSDAQYETRWSSYEINSAHNIYVKMFSGMATALLFGFSFHEPLLFPTIIIPGRIKNYLINKHKNSMKEKIMQPMDYSEIRI